MLIHMTDYILHNMNEEKRTGVVFLDLKKAFDMVDNDYLHHKVSYIGVVDNRIKCFDSYLRNRNQSVSYMGAISDKTDVECGMPQGSILDSLLFVLFTNDLPDNISKCKIFNDVFPL